ncbi:hypothetical protein D9M72_118730 [compost metagenome]|jgi:hypothetical protein
MPDALILLAAILCAIAGMGWLALAMPVHWEQACGDAPCSSRTRSALRWLGAFALSASLALCLAADHASMASLVWVMVLAGSALLVAFTLAWRAHWLGLLAGKS